MSIKIRDSRNIRNASAIDPKVRLQINQMSIKIESSRNITNVPAIDPKVRLQMATSVCVSDLIQTHQLMSIKTESSRNITNVSATHVKISQLVASLQTSRQQVVFARLVTTCQQVWNKLLTTCNNLVDIIRLVTRLFQQVCYNNDITILLQSCVVNLVTFLLYHDCSRLVRTTCNRSDYAIKLVTSC